jgi:hypothetical protein
MNSKRSTLIEVFTKKAEDYVSSDFLIFDETVNVKDCIEKMQSEKKYTALILKNKNRERCSSKINISIQARRFIKPIHEPTSRIRLRL